MSAPFILYVLPTERSLLFLFFSFHLFDGKVEARTHKDKT